MEIAGSEKVLDSFLREQLESAADLRELRRRVEGVFRNGNWKLDVDGNGRWTDADLNLQFGESGDLPVVGDFNGDGIDDLAIFRDGVLYIDANGNRRLDSNDLIVHRGDSNRGIPVVGKWTGGAADRIGWYEQLEPQKTAMAGRLDAKK